MVKMKATIYKYNLLHFFNLLIGAIFVRLLPQAPYLIEEDTVAPHITGSRVLTILDGLRSRPLHWDLTTVGCVDLLVLEISGKTKVCYLQLVQKN